MTFSARIERGNWANQVRRLIEAYGKGADEVLRSQARLFVRDAMRFTPPFANAPITESWKTQLDAGIIAIIGDMNRMMIGASQVRVLTSNSAKSDSRGTHIWLAGLYNTNRAEFMDRLNNQFNVRFESIIERPEKHLVDANLDGRKRYKKRYARFLIYNGKLGVPFFERKDAKSVPIELAAIVEERTKLIGLAKAGWMTAASALGLRGVPKWIKNKAGKSQGIYEKRGSGLKVEYTLGSRVPWMQSKGRELNIIERAWKNRQRNIEKEIEAVMKAKAKKALKEAK